MSQPDDNSDLKDQPTSADPPTAGKTIPAAETVKTCLQEKEKPSTPPTVKKFRAQTAFGTAKRHPGKANDPDVASKLVHGIKTTTSPSIHSVLNPPQTSRFQEKVQELSETVYRSRAPLGRSRYQTPVNENIVHGIKTEKGVGARETIYPLQALEEMPLRGRRTSVKSRISCFVGEQINRNYDPHHFNKDHTFGICTPHHNDGRDVGKALCWLEKPEK